MDIDELRLRQQKVIEDMVTLEFNELTQSYDIMDINGKKIGCVDVSQIENPVSIENSELSKKFIITEKQRKVALDYLEQIKKMNKEELEQERKNALNNIFDLGDDLNGNNLAYRDLKLALITGSDLDGYDIPGDTPKERNAEYDKNKEIKKGDNDERYY